MILAKEMTAAVLQAKLDAIKMKEMDDPQSVNNTFDELARLYTASGSNLTPTMKKTQLIKVMPSLYSGCINTANQAGQSMAMAKALNDLIAKINLGSAASAAATANLIDMGAI